MEGHPTTGLVPDLLLHAARTVTASQGQAVFEQDAPGEAAYLVVEGKVKIIQRTDSGPSNVLALLGPGHVFGELSLFDGGARSASAYAVTSVTLRELDRDRLDELLHAHSDVAIWLIQQLAHRLRRATDSAAELVFSDVPARLAQILLDLADQFGRQDGGVVLVDHGLTQLELAQLVGAARESVNKALSAFATRGWIRVEGRTAHILDQDALTRRAGRSAPDRLDRSADTASQNSLDTGRPTSHRPPTLNEQRAPHDQ